MADIYLAQLGTEVGATRLCVLKEVLEPLSRDPGFANMLVTEAKLAAQLSHANVVQVFDLGREEGRLFIAMEYVEGFDLNQLLAKLSKTRTPLPAEYALYIVREMLRGLDYAHRAKQADGTPLGIVHRDVSPSNVLVSFEGEVKLCDFGIARAVHVQQQEDLVARSRVVGKSAYMSPEQAAGLDLDARSDLFSAAIILFELCAGRRLFRGTDEETLALVRNALIPPLPERGLPQQAELEVLLRRALARDPEQRFQSAKEFLGALDKYIAQSRLGASPLRFASFLTDHFAEEIVRGRRASELASQGLLDSRSSQGIELPAERDLPPDSGVHHLADMPNLAAKQGEIEETLRVSRASSAPRGHAPGRVVALVLSLLAIATGVAAIVWLR